MLFGGEGIFGVIDFSEDSNAARCKADQISQRASLLEVRSRTEAFEGAVFGSVTRKFDDSECKRQAFDQMFPIAISGEVFSLKNHHGTVATQGADYGWIAEGYQTDGLKCLAQLDGTFALALWDPKSRTLTLLTDRRADARLFYRVEADQFLFSSWLALLAGPGQDLDRGAIQEFLRFLYIAPPRTIYNGISCLEPGHYLTACNGRILTQTLENDTAKETKSNFGQDSDKALTKFQELFEASVRRRIGQRRAGVFLSSGVDSATLMAACEKVNPGQVEAFTIGFDDAELDETAAAKAFARHVGVPHTELRFDLAQYRQAFDLLVESFDQPFADPAALPLILGSRAVADRVDVITGGTGGDDLFGAPIPRHLWFSLAISAKLPERSRDYAKALLPHFGLSRYVTLFDFDEVEELLITWRGWSKRELEELLGENVSFHGSGFYRAFRAHEGAGAQRLCDALGVFPPDDCRFEAAALANVPIELPYHDADLHAYVWSLPEALRTSNGSAKIILRRLFNRYFSRASLSAKKHYFNIPLARLLAEDNFALIREYLSADNVNRLGMVDADRAWPWIDRYVNGDENLKFKVWGLLVLHAWVAARGHGVGGS